MLRPHDSTVLSALIPASGSALRMRGLPKFLLPSGHEDLTLLELHIKNLVEHVDEILIGINPIFFELVKQSNINLSGARMVPLQTNTMTETVLNLAKQSLGNRFLMIMPDTVFEFHKGYIFDDSKSDLTLSLWRIRSDQYGKLGQVSVDMNGKVLDCVDKNPDCRYEFSWGAMSFNQKFLEILNNEFPHVGYGILPAIQSNLEVNSVVFPGRYWDCGTPLEYLRYLKTLEI